MSDKELNTNIRSITKEEINEYVRSWREITNCPEGKSFTQHLQELMKELFKYRRSENK